MRVMPCLWFERDMAAALATYVRLVPGSELQGITVIPGGTSVARFTLAGQPTMAFEAAPLDRPNHAVSIAIECDTQAEIDTLWHGLGEGGTYEQCGWLRDAWGFHWQIVPRALPDLLQPPGSPRAQRVFDAMLGMTKLDIATLHAAAHDTEIGGPAGPEPTRYGDWEVKGRASDF